jgi:serine-type D-Ala-D-Ala carboxypeptidase (penicillin-binding protein 5/6)
MLHRIIAIAVAGLSLSLNGCSDATPPQATQSLPATIPNLVASADSGTPIPAPPQVQAKGYFLMDQASGKVLAAMNENERLEPASLTKLMAAYAVFHALDHGRIKMQDQVTISAHARDQDGSRMFVEIGTMVSVADLIQGMIVQSGNDATVALAEHVAGSEPVFVDLMNQYAQQIGMTSTHFQNSPGMPGPEHYTTARDMALLAAALIRDFPKHYKYYSQREFTWNKITQPNRNGLLARDPTVDGLKTGHTESAGYCLVSSAKRESMRLVSIVMGSPSIRAREDASAALLNYGFRFYETRKILSANDQVLTVPVWKGAAEQATLGPVADIVVTIPRGQDSKLSATAHVPSPLLAPLTTDKSVGQLKLMHGDQELGSYPLHPVAAVEQAGFFSRLVDDVKLMFE